MIDDVCTPGNLEYAPLAPGELEKSARSYEANKVRYSRISATFALLFLLGKDWVEKQLEIIDKENPERII